MITGKAEVRQAGNPGTGGYHSKLREERTHLARVTRTCCSSSTHYPVAENNPVAAGFRLNCPTCPYRLSAWRRVVTDEPDPFCEVPFAVWSASSRDDVTLLWPLVAD